VKLDMATPFLPIGFTYDSHGLYGLLAEHGIQQLAIFHLEGNRIGAVPSTVIRLPRGVQSVIPSLDGKRFAIVADSRDPDSLNAIRHVITPQESSLYIVNVDGTDGQWWCTNLKNISGSIAGDGRALAWSADSESLAVLSHLPMIGNHRIQSGIDVCSASGTKHVTEIPNAVSGIAWTNDDHDIAFLSTTSPVLTPEHVWTVSITGKEGRDRTPALKGTAMQMVGDARGHIWVLVYHGVQDEIDEFRSGSLRRAYYWPRGVLQGLPIESPYINAREQVALTVGDPGASFNIAIPDDDGIRRVTRESMEELGATSLGEVRVVRWKNRSGVSLEGIATFPPHFVTGKRYPFLVLPHEGPEANDELDLNPLAQIIASLGYVVLQPEYRGSTGYGAEFLAAIYQHFGDRTFEDIDSATNYAISQGWADPNRLAIFGWSAGGFITAWTITQTNRYRAAIDGAGIVDWASFVWTSNVQQIDYDARWTDKEPSAFSRFSPTAFASKVKTPLLILHGENDRRVPLVQSMELFQLLAARGKIVRMVTYPGASHFPQLWDQRLDLVREIEDWLAKYNS
jgi:dipeptidyl aminopeptidase/acylaminoacyl peptidase